MVEQPSATCSGVVTGVIRSPTSSGTIFEGTSAVVQQRMGLKSEEKVVLACIER
jgi:hypothetical protein